jgi:hypothetical protein
MKWANDGSCDNKALLLCFSRQLWTVRWKKAAEKTTAPPERNKAQR